MARYVAIAPRADDWWSDRVAPPLPQPTVYEPEPVNTGLLDPTGRPIYRMPDQIGYRRTE